MDQVGSTRKTQTNTNFACHVALVTTISFSTPSSHTCRPPTTPLILFLLLLPLFPLALSFPCHHFGLGQTSRHPQRKSGVTPLPWSQTTSRSPYLHPTTPTRRLSLHTPVPLHSPFAPTIISPRCPPFYFPFQLLPRSPFLTGAAMTRRVYPFLTDARLHLSILHTPPNTITQPPCSATAMENASVHRSNPQQRLLVQRYFYIHHNFLLLTSFQGYHPPKDMELHALERFMQSAASK